MATRRLDRRQGFLISATVHLVILTLLARNPETMTRPAVVPTPAPSAEEPARKVVLVPRSVVERLLRTPAAPPARPAPAAPPRDRMSVGSPSREVRVLPRDQDFATPQGAPGHAGSAPTPAPSAEAQAQSGGPDQGPTVAGRGLEPLPRRGGGSPRPGTDQPRTITRSLEELDRRLGQMGAGGMNGATGRDIGGLFFDPEGADFTGWVNHFKNEVYRNWVPPQAVMFGYRGHVDFEFWVERDGTLTDLRMLKSSGTGALDRAAQNALVSSRLLPLPSDFAPARVRMQVTFYYNEAPQG